MDIDSDGLPPGPSPEQEKHDPSKPVDVWFDDGNLIIQSGEKTFRVYRGILSSASSIFRDMLSLAVTDEEQAIDGCPVVHVSDPTADISFFLRSLHDTECVVHCHLSLSLPSHTVTQVLPPASC
jgi:hypothetical protein